MVKVLVWWCSGVLRCNLQAYLSDQEGVPHPRDPGGQVSGRSLLSSLHCICVEIVGHAVVFDQKPLSECFPKVCNVAQQTWCRPRMYDRRSRKQSPENIVPLRIEYVER